MNTKLRVIDGKQYELQPDGKWQKTAYQQQLEADEQARQEQISARHVHSAPQACNGPAAFGAGLLTGSLLGLIL